MKSIKTQQDSGPERRIRTEEDRCRERTHVVGIIGGMGPAATCQLFKHIIDMTPARCDQDHLHVFIDSNPGVPDRTKAILGMGPSPLPWLLSSAKILEAAGAEVLAMPCVTAHNFIDELRHEVSVRILNIVEETQNYLTLNFSEVDRVGLLATTGTLSADVFCQLRSRYTILVPSEEDQLDVMVAIYGPEGVKTCGVTQTAYELLEKVIQRLINRGAEALIAACTEIPLVIRPDRTRIPILDTLLILAEAIIKEASGGGASFKAQRR